MSKLKVGIYHATLPGAAGKKGGVEAAVHRLAESLSRRGTVEVTVFSSGEPPEGAKYAHRSVLNRTNRAKITRLLLSPALMNVTDFGDVDLLHFHGDDWFYVRRAVPTIRTFHGSALHESRTATSVKRKLMQRLVYHLERLSARLATRSISVGTETQTLYRCHYNIGNSVDLSLFRPQEKTPFPSLFFVGTWEGRKRGSFLFDVFCRKILPVYPDAKLFFVADRCDPHPSVLHMKKIGDAELAETMARSWVFAYPSLYEGFGIPYIEAMAAGTPIVTTPNPGANEVLEHGRYGIICDDGMFAESLLRLLGSEDERRAFADAGTGRALQYGEDAIASQIEAVYHSAMQDRS
ncbi:glycosyltransferase family 4 protein [Ancylobacter lacus]|uniref:glycosyltransferase family 4 protein n=1 Tax=Ancylobacter lacus TaxID=2579970 RepID=UPI001BCE7567|nr:glycosyltransferase family 4 protein [Ancylobacter lacus]MBS7538481.1 glycosyltransferase family 4 protein [Ancylobacter lacus]